MSMLSTITPYPNRPTPKLAHLNPIKNALPSWALSLPPHTLTALKNTNPTLHASLKNITSTQNSVFKNLLYQRQVAHHNLETELANSLDVLAFAEPLLKQYINTHYLIDLDVNDIYINLYAPSTLPIVGFPDGGSRTWRVSLLQAALHNFELAESLPNAYLPESGFISRPDELGRFEARDDITQKMPIAGFIHLCRTLDLGKRYKAYLKELLGLNDRGKQIRLKEKIRDSHIANLKTDLAHGFLTQHTALDINESLTAYISNLNQDWQTFSFSLFSMAVDGVLIFIPNHMRSIVVSIPNDPLHPIKEYVSIGSFIDHLTTRLKSVSFQQFFSRLMDHDQLAAFFSALKHTYFKVIIDKPNAPDYALRDFGIAEEFVPISEPSIKYSTSRVEDDVWETLYSKKLAKIFKDAKTLAVSTDAEDRKTRQDRWDSIKRIGMALFNAALFVVAPFVPVIGEIMLLQMAYQLLEDVYEGVHDWVEGKALEAYEHMFSILETTVQIGLFAASAKIVGDLLPKTSAFVENLKPVKSNDGVTRLWQPDLTPYEHPTQPPATLVANSKGLHRYNDSEFLTIDNKTYRVQEGGRPAQYRIKHPVRPQTYSPRLRHNGSGAWSTETETPLQWTDAQLFRRLGPSYAAFTEEEAANILAISRTDNAVLRSIHDNALPAPAQLADTVQRFKIDKDIEQFIAQLESPDRATRLNADPYTQLQLLIDNEHWSATTGLRVLDPEGWVIVQYPPETISASYVNIYASQIEEGELLNAVLEELNASDSRLLLGVSPAIGDELPNLQVKIDKLSSNLAHQARLKRVELFNSRYTTLQLRGNAESALLQQAFPGLSSTGAQELIWHAQGDEVLQLLNQKTIPIRLQEEARWQVMESRVSRTYEGMFLNSFYNPDSEWLTLKTLESLPGWSKEVRLEIREDTFEGKVLNCIGEESAPIRKILIASENRYSARDALDQELHGADDLYSAVLHALPDAEREALGFPHPGQGSALKDRVRAQPLFPRTQVSQHLEQPVVALDFKSPMALTYGRVSYPLLGADAPDKSGSSIEALVHELYPSLNTLERARVMSSLPSTEVEAREVIAHRTREWHALRDDMELWTLNAPATNQRTGEMLSPNSIIARVQDRRAFSHELERAYRRQTAFDNHYADPARDGFELTFTRILIEDMPTINADFSHVTYLSLNGQGAITGINEFLQHFPGLRVLELRNFELDRLPDAVFTMQNLTELRLENSAITLTPESASGLAGLERLEYIDLDNNPLNITPDFSNMPNLNTVHLHNTELSVFPSTLLGLSELEIIDLSENLITHLPSELFEAPAYITSGLDLEDNPLSEDSLERVREYFAQTDIDMNIQLEDEDAIEQVVVSESEE